MTEELPGDPAAPSGSCPPDRAAAGVSPLRASIPIAWNRDFEHAARFLFDLLDDIDTTSDWAQGDNAAYRKAVESIQRRRFEVATTDGYTVRFHAQGIVSREAIETAQQARPEGPEPGPEGMRPDDPATIADLQRQLAEADAVIADIAQKFEFTRIPPDSWCGQAIARHEARAPLTPPRTEGDAT